jgi:hypothetical protein
MVGETGLVSKLKGKPEPEPGVGREVEDGLGDDLYVVESFKSIARLVARGVVLAVLGLVCRLVLVGMTSGGAAGIVGTLNALCIPAIFWVLGDDDSIASRMGSKAIVHARLKVVSTDSSPTFLYAVPRNYCPRDFSCALYLILHEK